jgi:aspartyl-tRNA(Asn)/glutamyl-tRNA(Gln) amidotransferase subunit A
MNPDIVYQSLTETAGQLRRGVIGSEELARLLLERIARVDPLLNCFITLTGERALEQAHAQDANWLGGEQPGPLAGVPLALKDLFQTRGVRTTAGSTFFQDWIPDENAASVQRLEDAGAVQLGKLNMHEIALGVTNVNPHYGACRNPWDPERIPGGSSGGSAAALAAGLCFGSLGSDTGGSIRIPSSLCGIVGLKPTTGRVSLRGVVPLSWNLDHAGPMARRVEDAARLLQIVAGYDPDDSASLPVPVDDYDGRIKEGVKGWRIALASDEYFNQADPQVLAAVQAAAQVFESLGAHVTAVPFPGASLATAQIVTVQQSALANSQMTTSDGAAFHRERLQEHPEGFGEDVLKRLQQGAALTSSEYILARRTQALVKRQFERFFEHWDILLTPTTPITAPLIAGPDALEQARLLTRFTSPFNLSGLPAISIPCGFTKDNLPVGLQLVSRPWAEADLLRAAYSYEMATGWYRYHPSSLEGS